jgi:NitT/TauT family transport system ATP-binding protein
MDEPFAALDAQTRELMQMELLRIWRETGKTILFVTHQLDEAVFLADRVVALSARPGSIREIVTIDLPQPRDLDTKRSAAFQAYVSRLWRLIESDVRRGFQSETAQNA